MNGIPALVYTHIIPHITPLSSPFDVSERELATVPLFFIAHTAMSLHVCVCVYVRDRAIECLLFKGSRGGALLKAY